MHKSLGLTRKSELIHGAIELIAQEGVEELTFEKLARSQKLKRAHVAYYFKTRTDLLEALLIEILTQGAKLIEEKFNEGLSSRARGWDRELTAYCEAQEYWVHERHSHVKCLLLLYHLGSANPRFRDLLRKSRDRGQLRLLQLLSRHPKLGNLPLQKITAYCQALHEAVTGYLLYLAAFLDDDQKELDPPTSLRERLAILLP